MAIIEVELNIEQQGSGYFQISPTLSGKVYLFTMNWSYRTQSWYLDIDETVKGIKIVNGINILEPYQYNDDLLPGSLGAHRNTGRDSKPGFFNFGINNEMTLLYEEP